MNNQWSLNLKLNDITTILCYSLFIMRCIIIFFFFNDTATTEIYTLSLHDALPILGAFDGRDDLDQAVFLRDLDAHADEAARGALAEFLVGLLVERSEEHTSELQSQSNLVCRLLLEKKKKMLL